MSLAKVLVVGVSASERKYPQSFYWKHCSRVSRWRTNVRLLNRNWMRTWQLIQLFVGDRTGLTNCARHWWKQRIARSLALKFGSNSETVDVLFDFFNPSNRKPLLAAREIGIIMWLLRRAANVRAQSVDASSAFAIRQKQQKNERDYTNRTCRMRRSAETSLLCVKNTFPVYALKRLRRDSKITDYLRKSARWNSEWLGSMRENPVTAGRFCCFRFANLV